jgi:protein SCO1/2
MPRHYIVDSVNVRNVNGEKKYDTAFHTISDLRLINQLGESVSIDSDLQGKILVFDFFFINCPSICPRLTANMGLLQKSFRKILHKENNFDTVVQFISITVNPSSDSFPRMRAYADKHGANPDHWWFLTGDKKVIYNFARNELFVTVSPGDGGPEDFIHTEKMVLVDKNRQIRGYYNGLDTVEVRKCADDIVLLTLEKQKGKGR